MKNEIFKAALPAIILSILGVLIIVGPCTAQIADTSGLDQWNPFDGPVTIDRLMNLFNPLYGAIVIIWGYVAKTLKLKSDKVPFVFVVLAGGLVAAGVFLTQGFSAVGIVISFFAALGIFDLILKPAGQLVNKKKIAGPEPPHAF